MSRVEGKSPSQFSDLANLTIANELESRLKELERNIAVARQFIKLADESYARIRHEWDLLQQDIRPRKTATETTLDTLTPEWETPQPDRFADPVEPKKRTEQKPYKNKKHNLTIAPVKPSNEPHHSDVDTLAKGHVRSTHQDIDSGVSKGIPKLARPKRKA